jgi:adenylate cyclase
MAVMSRTEGTSRPTTDEFQPAESRAVRRLRAWLFASVFVGLSTWLWFWPSWHLLEEQARDALTTRFAISETTHPQVVLVDFSDASIQALGGWPLDRRQMADLVEELLGPLGAKVVGLDMMFPEAGDPQGDARLASLAEHGPLVLSHVLDMQQRSNPIRVGMPANKSATPQLMAQQWTAQPSFGFVANHAGLSRARCVGHVGVSLDADGVVRRLSPLVQGPEGVLSTLAAAMLDCGQPTAQPATALPHVTRPVPLPAKTGWRLPFTYGVGAFHAVDASEVLAGTVDASRIQGKYVLVGSSAVGLSDYVTTPLQALTPGVLVHAQALAQLLDHGVPQPDDGPQGTVLWVTAVLAALIWWLWRKHKTAAWTVGLGSVLVWPAWVVAGYVHGVFAWALFVPTVVLACLVSITALEFKLLRDIKLRALNTLSQYVAAPVLKQLYAMGLTSSLQPKLQEITVLVVDMRDYTRLTTEMPLDEVADLTRDFLALITQPVLQHEGTLDRYSGDGLIAFWGAPLPQSDHADLALACTDSLVAALKNWNAERARRGLEPIGMRMGVESGQALVGDVGNSARSVFTAVGLCINTASRLQELGRQLHCDLVIGPNTAALASRTLAPLAVVEVKGLRSALQVYTRQAS